MRKSDYENLTPEQQALVSPEEKPSNMKYIIGGAVLVILLGLAAFFLIPKDQSPKGNEVVTGEDAYRLAKEIVTDTLKDRKSIDFITDRTKIFKMGTDSVYVIKGAVESTDDAGSVGISEYAIQLTYKGGDWKERVNWVVDEFKIN
ncbi:MAG: hypothetical protein ACOH2A_06075 [Sphingobacteriaceae bacterium]